MSRRQQSKQQRRKCPEFRNQKATQADKRPIAGGPFAPKKPHAPKRPLNKKGIPILSPEDIPSELFTKEVETSFAEVVDQTMTDPLVQQALQETLTTRANAAPPTTTAHKHFPAPHSELDLHGATGPEAETRAAAFITAGYHKHLPSLRIITGKGLHSEKGPVLPDIVEQTVLKLKKQGLVRTFRWENKEKTKSGAIIVYLT